MRIFYEAWCSMFENRPLSADDLQNSIIPVGDKGYIEIRPLATDELPPETLEAFLAVGFTNHYEILFCRGIMGTVILVISRGQ